MMRSHIATIGNRSVPPDFEKILLKIGQDIAYHGYCLNSGNASGSDELFARGANDVDPALVHLFLPWRGFRSESIKEGNKVTVFDPYSPDHEEAMRFAGGIHVNWNLCSDPVRKLHARNVLIVKDTIAVVAYQTKHRGGTQLGMNVAQFWGIPIFNIAIDRDLDRLYRELLS